MAIDKFAAFESARAAAEGDPFEALFAAASCRFAGFSLERRQEWERGPWRVRVLPNKQERQDYKIEVYGVTPKEALWNAILAIRAADRAREMSHGSSSGHQ